MFKGQDLNTCPYFNRGDKLIMKKIAIITGASSGIGKEFTLDLKNREEFEEVWVIARDREGLEKLKDEVDFNLKVMPMDLTKDESYEEFKKVLEEEKPDVKLLINCSGYGKFDKTTNLTYKENIGMIDLNCRGLTSLTILTIPYMKSGANIINIASVAAFQPLPYVNVYAATKSYVLSFSRGLNMELKQDGIHVMAVCPFWTRTKFFERAIDKSKAPVIKKYTAMYEPYMIVNRTWRDLKRKKDVSKYGFVARFQAGLCKVLPHSFVMKYWMHQQKLK